MFLERFIKYKEWSSMVKVKNRTFEKSWNFFSRQQKRKVLKYIVLSAPKTWTLFSRHLCLFPRKRNDVGPLVSIMSSPAAFSFILSPHEMLSAGDCSPQSSYCISLSIVRSSIFSALTKTFFEPLFTLLLKFLSCKTAFC